MTISELLNSRTREDLEVIAAHLSKTYPNYYKDTKKGIEHFLFFVSECNKCKIVDKSDLVDFVITIDTVVDDLTDDVPYIDDKETQIDFEKLERYYSVGGVHLKELINKQDTLTFTMEELKNSDSMPVTSWGIDFMDRGQLMNREILQLCLDKIDINVIAAEIFWEMTFNGLENEAVDERTEKLEKLATEIHEYKNLDEAIKEADEKAEKENSRNSTFREWYEQYKPSQKEMDNMRAICEYNRELINNFYIEYIDKYKDTQIKRLIDKFDELNKDELEK